MEFVVKLERFWGKSGFVMVVKSLPVCAGPRKRVWRPRFVYQQRRHIQTGVTDYSVSSAMNIGPYNYGSKACSRLKLNTYNDVVWNLWSSSSSFHVRFKGVVLGLIRDTKQLTFQFTYIHVS